MKDKKAKYLLLVIAGLTMLSLISIKQIVLFKPRETVNKTQKEIYSREINPQTKPEDVVKIFLTRMNKGLKDQSELKNAWVLITNKLQRTVSESGAGSSNLLSNLLKILNMEDPTYREAEVINNGYKDGAFSIDLKLIYPDALIVRTLKMVIEDEIWKIDQVLEVETLKSPDTQTISGWKTLKNNLYEIKYPQSWVITKNTAEAAVIQNNTRLLDKVADYPAGGAKIQISILNSDASRPIDNVVNCESVPNSSCRHVYLNDQIYREIKTNTGSGSKFTLIYVGSTPEKDILLTVAVNTETQPELESLLKSIISTFKML